MTSDAQSSESTDDLDGTLVVEEPRFALVPEWVIDAAIPDAAFRLYSLLLRYGNGSGSRMPSRSTLARRLRRSVDAVDRAMRQLSDTGIVRIAPAGGRAVPVQPLPRAHVAARSGTD